MATEAATDRERTIGIEEVSEEYSNETSRKFTGQGDDDRFTAEFRSGRSASDATGKADFTSTETKRRRGRPPGRSRGNKAQPTGSDTEETIGVQAQALGDDNRKENRKRKGRPPKRSTKLNEKEAIEQSILILDTVQSIGVKLLGTEAAFNEFEQFMLSTSFPKLLMTFDIEKVERVTNLLFPIMGIAGIGSYMWRLFNISSDRIREATEKAEEQSRQATASPETPFQSNGYQSPVNPNNPDEVKSWNNGLKDNKLGMLLPL